MVREERKVITALFCDLVGSTALGERMDHEDLARLQSQYQEICRRVIESHGGVVEKFIGDAVVGIFGVPVAHEDDPERAVRAGLRIVQDVETSGLELEVRIGINTGEALVRLDVDPRSGEGFATGDCLNTAARLEAAAPVMAVVVGEATHAACARAIAFEALEAIPAKGKTAPVAMWRALEPRSREVRSEVDRAPFVGRGPELSMLTQLFDRSRTRGSVEFVTIIAEPGLGKSRLVRELRRHADAASDHTIWHEGRCLPYGDGISFSALGEIIRTHAGILETDDQHSIETKLHAVMAEPDPQIRGWLTDRLAPLVGLDTATAPPDQQEAFNAWRMFLESLARQSPTVLVIEDLHWADDAFVAFLGHLTERAVGVPLLVVVTARPEVEERHPSWPPGRRSTVLPLAPLDDVDLASLISATMSAASPEFTSVVLARAGGSPLFAEQLVAMLHEQLPVQAEAAFEASRVPTSVQALIAARIDGLPPAAKQVLMEASVVGRNFWTGAIECLGDHADLEVSLAELVRRELCRPVHPSTMGGESEFSFWHALVRDVAYAQLTKAERSRMHVAVARWMAGHSGQALGEQAEILVHHIDAARELGTTEDTDSLLRVALIEAGRSAMRTDVVKAIQVLPRALDLLASDDPQRVETAHALGRALLAQGRFTDAISTLEPLVRTLIETDELEAAVGVGIDLDAAMFSGLGEGLGARSRIILHGLLDRLGEQESPAATQLLAWHAFALQHHNPGASLSDAAVIARRSIAMADAIGIPAPALALKTLGSIALFGADPEGEALLRQASAAHLAEGNLVAASTCLGSLAIDYTIFHSPQRGIAIIDEAIAFAEHVGIQAHAWRGRAARLAAQTLLGDLESVKEHAPAVLEWAEGSGDFFSRNCAMQALIMAREHIDASSNDLAGLLEVSQSMMAGGWLAAWTLPLLVERGDHEAAGPRLRTLLPRLDDVELLDATRTAVALGEPDLVRELVRRDRVVAPVRAALRLAASAKLAEYDGDASTARDDYEAAVQAFGQLGMLPERARSLTELGRCLAALKQNAEARARLLQARDLWVGMKATRRIAEVDALLASSG